LPRPELTGELSLSAEAFNRKFKGSPVKRAKRRGYLRNVAIALGNLGDPQAVSSLLDALRRDPEALVRGAAAWALGRLGGDAARTGLQAALQAEADAEAQQEIRRALAHLHSPLQAERLADGELRGTKE
jgi:epoxyqueuosine reductase